MNALMTIKTAATAKPAAEPAQAATSNADNRFSEALEKQVKGNDKAQSSREAQVNQTAAKDKPQDRPAAKNDEAAVTASEDGKKLPPADNEKNAVTAENTEQDPATQQTAENTDTESQATDSDNVDISLEVDESVANTDEEQNADQEGESQQTGVTVAVAAPAMQNAATDKVTMTLSENAKAGSKSNTAENKADGKAVLQNLTPVLNDDGEVTTTSAKTRFADILKQDGLAQNAIRADILQAISKKGDSQDGDAQTLKTSLQNLLVNADNKAAQNGQVAELVRQIQPGQQRGSDQRASAGLVAALTPTASAPGQVSSASAPQLAMDVQPQLNSAAWSRVVSSRVVWMAREGVQQAELRLNPASLGSVEVRLNINNDQASVTFLAQNAATRDALEQAMPRLRESLAENGLSLTHSEVGHQEHSEQQAAEDEKNMQNAHLAQVSVPLDDTEDELPAGIQPEVNDLSTGVSLYA